MKVLVTGANGFVGRPLCHLLADAGYEVRAAVRDCNRTPLEELMDVISVGDINGETDWGHALAGVDVVVHLAARVHVMRETHRDPRQAFLDTNVAGLESLAKQSCREGVERFVFMSTIKVNGEQTTHVPFRTTDVPNPGDYYSESKLEAESRLVEIAGTFGMEYTIVRPPLVYGPGVKGNFSKLLKLVRAGLPVPLNGINNKRSMVSLINLCDFVVRAVSHPAAANQVLLVSDGEDWSTPELVQHLAQALNVPSRLFPAPLPVLKALASVFGAGRALARLSESLQVDSRDSMARLEWMPPQTPSEGIREVARWYLRGDSREHGMG